MGQRSKIEWTEVTWNPVTGCTRVSPGCAHCYAERIAYRFAGMHGFPRRPHHFDVTLHPERLAQPQSWSKPRLVFVNSMSDLFHENVPVDFVLQVMAAMRAATRHTFQILTKRSARLLDLDSQIEWPPNVWLGVSVENSDCLYRVEALEKTAAPIKFLSLEPLLGPLPDLDVRNVDWVIVGGESGPKARPMKQEWVTGIRNRCLAHSIPFFFKQWGGLYPKQNGRQLEGRVWDEMPYDSAMTQHSSLFVAD